MSRYSSGYSSSSAYSSYRSPYLDTGTSSSSSSYLPSSYYSSSSTTSPSYTLPSYESKFESLITRPDGTTRSRAGTSTKYDYLSSYANKYDFITKPSSGHSVSSYTSKHLDADDLTRSYFEKYYNRGGSSTSTTSKYDTTSSVTSPGRTSRAYSVYLDEDSSSSLRSALTNDTRGKRSSSVLTDSILSRERSGGSDSLLQRTLDNNSARLNRALSIYDGDSDNSHKKDYSRFLQSDDDSTTTARRRDSVTTGYSSTSSYRRQESSSGTTPDYRSPRREEETSNGYTTQLERQDSAREYGGYSRYSSSYSKDATEDSRNGFSRRDSTRTYGGRSATNRQDSGEETTSTLSRYREQNGGSSQTENNGGGEVAGTSGLRNIGNTCFMNSVIQCLSNTRLLCEYLLTDDFSRDINSNSAMKGSLIKAFATVIKGLWRGAGKVVDPSSLKGALQRFAPRFSGYNQEDSQEFLRYLLEGMHEDVNRIQTKPQAIHTEIDSSLSVSEQAMEAWKRYIRRDDSRLVDLFVGQLKSTLRCDTCNYESVTFEPFWDLSLPIPSRSGDVSLTDCFEAFTKEEVLDGDEKPTCDSCKCRRRCVKFYSLYKLPKILVVHLKRFSPTERFRSKLSSTVSFPLSGFDLSRYSDSHGTANYSCYAVSNHSGTLYSGHYTAYAKHHKTGQWYFYNDSRVSKCSSSNVISNEAYLLFFELS